MASFYEFVCQNLRCGIAFLSDSVYNAINSNFGGCIMKKLSVRKDERCMACLSCVRACSEAFYKVFDQAKSCIQIVEKNGEPKVNVCIQCGKCMRTCKHEAITQNPKTGVYMINKKKCVGCGECVAACPMKVMVLQGETVSKCISCGICAKACPMDLLEVIEK